jgi:ferredoxin/flavodoxin
MSSLYFFFFRYDADLLSFSMKSLFLIRTRLICLLPFPRVCTIIGIMKTEIYYFSATGNTLLLARDGAERLEGRLIPFSSLRPLPFITSQADAVGFYFPVYHASFGESGIPFFIRDIIGSFHGLKDKFVFALCTHSGFPGSALTHLDRILQESGASLAAGLDVEMGTSYGSLSKIAHLIFDRPLNFDGEEETARREILLRRYRDRVGKSGFFEKIARGENCRLWKNSRTPPFLMGGLLRLFRKQAISRYRDLARFGGDDFRELTRFADRSFSLSENCTGCGICERICPVDNIEVLSGRPQWQHRCENCSACFQWCPEGAIGGRAVEYEKRYHFPALSLKDLLGDDSC